MKNDDDVEISFYMGFGKPRGGVSLPDDNIFWNVCYVDSKTNKVNLKQKLMSSLSPSMITSTSKLNKYADDIDSNEINNIIKTMNLIASE